MLTPTDKILLLDFFSSVLEQNLTADIDNLIYQMRLKDDEKEFIDKVADLICD